MKKYALLVFSMAALALTAGCSIDETTSKDADLAGVNVAVGEKKGAFKKLFVLNEGGFQKNNSTLDFLRFSDGNYVSDAFGSMNPAVVQGLGDTGNDLALQGGKLWLVMNGSGYVHVLDARDETLVASIAVPDPRYIAFDDSHAYVSSYAGAVYGGDEKKGKVYRIDLKTNKIDGEVEVGCQPEGLAVNGNNLLVANSGGYNLVHENTMSVIDLSTFKLNHNITVASNLHFVATDGKGSVWVSRYGEYQYDMVTWESSMTEPMSLYKINGSGATEVKDVHVSCMTYCEDGYLYAIGNAAELNGGSDNTLYKVSTSGIVSSKSLSGTDASKVGTPYGICVNPKNGDIYITDAGDFVSPGKVWCFTKDLKTKWSAVAGIIPAHMALY